MVDMADFMTRLRALCAGLPEAEEYLMHGHPSFRAGSKAFAIVSDGSGHEVDFGISVKVDLLEQPVVLEDPRFARTHYIGQHGWVTLDLSSEWTWGELERLVLNSYRRVALKRMLKALDAQASA